MDKIIPTQGRDESVVLFGADDDCEVLEVELDTIIELDQCERWFRRRGGRGKSAFPSHGASFGSTEDDLFAEALQWLRYWRV